MPFLSEDEIEEYALQRLDSLGYDYQNGYDIQPDGQYPERESFSQVILKERLQNAIAKLNPHLPADIQQQGQRQLLNIASPDLINNNEIFHQYLTEGITVEYQQDGDTRGELLRLIDWDHPENNEFLAVNQFNEKFPVCLLIMVS